MFEEIRLTISIYRFLFSRFFKLLGQNMKDRQIQCFEPRNQWTDFSSRYLVNDERHVRGSLDSFFLQISDGRVLLSPAGVSHVMGLQQQYQSGMKRNFSKCLFEQGFISPRMLVNQYFQEETGTNQGIIDHYRDKEVFPNAGRGYRYLLMMVVSEGILKKVVGKCSRSRLVRLCSI